MFCTALRRRASYASSLPKLTAHPGLALRESHLDTHDLALPIQAHVNPKTGWTLVDRHLRVLLLSPTCVSDSKLQNTIQRIQHFASLTDGQDLLTIFLLNPPRDTSFISAKEIHGLDTSLTTTQEGQAVGMHAYQKLQASVFDRPDIASLPMLPVSNLDSLPNVLQTYLQSLTRAPPPRLPSPPSVLEMIRLCTANPPMPEQTAYYLSDLFGSIAELAQACVASPSAATPSSPLTHGGSIVSSSQGLNENMPTLDLDSQWEGDVGKILRVRDLVGETEWRNIIDFWVEEWALD